MDSVAVTVPLRPPTKKMKKRKELDALVPPHAVSRRTTGKRSSQELLTDSSDECSEFWNVSPRVNRKSRHGSSQSCPGLLRACGAFLVCAAIIATASLIWLFIDVRQQLTTLRNELDQVAESAVLSNTIQKCDSTSEELQKNQKNIFTQLSNFKAQLDNFTVQMVAVQRGLHEVQDSLKAEPQLANLPRDFESLRNSLVEVGSQISDMKPTVDALKEENTNLLNTQHLIQQNISNLKTSLLELSNVPEKPNLLSTNETNIKINQLKSNFAELAKNLSSITQNFTTTVGWILDDQTKNHKTLYSLKDESLNISVNVQSLRGECNEIRTQIMEIQSRDSEFNRALKQLEHKYNILANSQAPVLRTENQPPTSVLENSGGINLPFARGAEHKLEQSKPEPDHKNPE